jgi:hypothetical protein
MNGEKSQDRRVLLLGGLGRVARAFIFLALSEQRFPHIAVFDVAPNGPPLPQPVVRLPQRSLSELSPGLFSEYDVVVNALPVSLSKQILEIASKSECSTYVDLSTDELETPEQLEYSEMFAKEGRLLLSNVGVAPGLDNMLVAELVDKGASWVKIYLIEHSTDKAYIPSWCEEDAAISSADNPVSYDGHGEFQRHEPFDSPEELMTSAGTFTFFRFFGEEVLSLAHNYPTLRIDHKAGGHEVEVARDVVNGKEVHITSASENNEPQGVFGIKVLSSVGNVEVILKNTTQLHAEGLPGNHISFHTGAMLYYSLKHALQSPDGKKLVGTVFPENLPVETRAAILKDVREKLATNFTLLNNDIVPASTVESADKCPEQTVLLERSHWCHVPAA